MRTFTIDEAAAVLRVSPRSLGDRRFRCRLGLQALKVGRRLVFAEEDIRLLLERSRERFPKERGR